MNIDELLGSGTATTSEETVSATTIPEEKAEVAPVEKETKPKKKKGKPRGGNSPVIGMNGYNLEPGDNTKFLQLNMELFNMPSIDLHDEEAVAKRLDEYFALYAKYDTKPTVAGMAMALGMNRRTLIAIVNDYATGGSGYKTALPQEVALVIKKAHSLLENLWENYSTNGKINPVTAIFLGKNNFGYQDKTEYVVTPNVQQDNYDPDSIRQRYLIDSANDSDEEND